MAERSLGTTDRFASMMRTAFVPSGAVSSTSASTLPSATATSSATPVDQPAGKRACTSLVARRRTSTSRVGGSLADPDRRLDPKNTFHGLMREIANFRSQRNQHISRTRQRQAAWIPQPVPRPGRGATMSWPRRVPRPDTPTRHVVQTTGQGPIYSGGRSWFGRPPGAVGVTGNPVEVRDCPAAVSGNDRRRMTLGHRPGK